MASNEVVSLYDQRAPNYDKCMNRLLYGRAVEEILQTAAEMNEFPRRILDLGCGTGITTQALESIYPDAQIIGADCSEGMLSLYRARHPRSAVVRADFNDPESFRDLPANYLDMVVTTCAVSEYGDLDVSIPLVRTLLKRNGAFVTIGIKDGPFSRLTGAVWKYKANGVDEYMRACEDFGFHDIKRIEFPWRPASLIARATRFGVNALK